MNFFFFFPCNEGPKYGKAWTWWVCLRNKGREIKSSYAFSGLLSKLFPVYQYLHKFSHLLEYHLQFSTFVLSLIFPPNLVKDVFCFFSH